MMSKKHAKRITQQTTTKTIKTTKRSKEKRSIHDSNRI